MSPHLLVIAAYCCLAAFVYAPGLFSGAVLVSGDSLRFMWSQYVWFGSFAQQGWQGWLPQQFLGTSFLGTSETALLYPPHLLFLILPPELAHNLLMLFHLVLAAFGTWLFLRALDVEAGPAFLGGLVFACSGALMAHRAHPAIYSTAAWLPLVALTQYRWLQTGRSSWAGLGALVVGHQALAGNFQVFVYSAIAIAVAVCTAAVSGPPGRRMGLVVRAAIPFTLGVSVALPQILASQQLAQEAWRTSAGYAFFREYNLTLLMLPMLVAPFLFGCNYGGPYWGEWNINELGGSVGCLPLLIALGFLLGQWGTDKRARVGGVVACVLLILALGDSLPIGRLLYYVPVYNLFRCPARHLLALDFVLAALFALGLDALLKGTDRGGWSPLRRRLLTVAALFLVSAVLVKALLNSTMAPNLLTAEGRQHLSYSFSRHNPAFVLPLLFLAAGAGLTVLASRLRSKVAIHLLLGTLILAELASFFFPLEGRWTSPAEIAAGQHKQLNSSLRDQAGYERILSLSDESSFNLPYGVNRLNAWQSLHPRRLFDLLESRPANNSSQVNEWEATLESNLPLSLLNVRYLTAEAGSNEAQQIRERRLHRPGPMKPVGPAVTSRLGPARALEVPVALEPGRTYELSFRTRNSGPEGFAVFSPESLKDGVHSVTLRETAGPERTVTHLLRTPTGVPGQGLLRFEGPESGGVADVRWGILEEVPGAPPPYERLDAIEGTELFRNRYCLPRAFCVAELKVVDGFEAIKRALFLGEVDPTRTALILPDEPILPRAVPRSTGTARILAFEPDRVHVEVSSARGTFLVLADQADPGWSATVDGRRTPLLAPFGFLRGLDVPAGVHEVRFDYRPAWMWQGIPPAAVALLVIVALLLGGRKRCHGSGSSASQKL